MLAGRVNEGLATEAELAEYEALVSAADFISVLKLKARRRLQEQAAPVGVRGVDILGVAGTLDQVSAREMREAIEEGCGMQSIGYGITPENRHGETEWGDAAGKEEW